VGLIGLAAIGTSAYADGSIKYGAVPEQPPERGVVFGGVDIVNGAQYYFDGIIVSLNGDMNKDGFVLRAYGSLVDYDLNPGHGQGLQTDLMLGYHINRDRYDASIYIGGDWQNYTLHPENFTDNPRGTEFGFKVAADMETSKELPYYLALNGMYSTAFDSFWVRARTGFNRDGFYRDRITFGPEAIVMGNTGFDAQRVGGFVTFDLKLLPGRPPVEITFSSGYQFVNGSNNDSTSTGNNSSSGGGQGVYGAVVLSTTF
jgi:Cellulose biosynthesis protein BcsS